MNQVQYLEFHRKQCDRMIKITEAKNRDYAGAGNAFANFTGVEAFGFATTEQGFLTRMYDKFSRVSNFVKNGELMVKDESVEDTLLDLANYSILFMGYIQSKKKEKGVEIIGSTLDTNRK